MNVDVDTALICDLIVYLGLPVEPEELMMRTGSELSVGSHSAIGMSSLMSSDTLVHSGMSSPSQPSGVT